MADNKSDLNDRDLSILNSYQYAKGKISTLPEGVSFIGGALDLRASCVDMIPAGLQGIDSVYFYDIPKFIAPDYTGEVHVDKFDHIYRLRNLKSYKDRYIRCQKFVEMPRYLNGELCTLPKNMRFFKGEDGYCLDLRKTSIRYVFAISGITRIIHENAPEFFRPDFPKKIAHHRGRQTVHSKPRIKE